MQNSGAENMFDKAVGIKLKTELALNELVVLNLKDKNPFFASVKEI